MANKTKESNSNQVSTVKRGPGRPRKTPEMRPTEEHLEQALVAYNPLHHAMQLGRSVVDVIQSIPQLDDDQLKGLFSNTVQVERGLFAIRGAAAYEIVKRAKEQGQKIEKTKGNGVDTLIADVAKDVGVDAKTLYTDFCVFEEFGGDLMLDLTESPESILPREFYTTAVKCRTLAAESVGDILLYFKERRMTTGGYFTDHARRDAKLFNEGRSVDEVRQLDEEARVAYVKGKNKPASKVEKIKTANVPIHQTAQNVEWIGKIVQQYGSFNVWFESKCEDEFGRAVRDTGAAAAAATQD